jgi:hypothetical protein
MDAGYVNAMTEWHGDVNQAGGWSQFAPLRRKSLLPGVENSGEGYPLLATFGCLLAVSRQVCVWMWCDRCDATNTADLSDSGWY